MLTIPEDFTEFLYWIKERTEALWQRPPATSDAEYDYPEGLRGARWLPLSEAEIDAVEARYGVRFIPKHRAFLRVLHAIDRREQYSEIRSELNLETVEYEDVTYHIDDAYFYNWLTEEAEISYRLAWPYETILGDVFSPFGPHWLPAWGPRPASPQEQKAVVDRWYAEAPRLLPLKGKLFLVGESGQPEHPVLSMLGFDTIVMYEDLRRFLLSELARSIPEILEQELDDFTQERLLRPEVQQLFDVQRIADLGKSLPYWKGLILYWNTGKT